MRGGSQSKGRERDPDNDVSLVMENYSVHRKTPGPVPDEVRGLYESIDDSEVLQSKINERSRLINSLPNLKEPSPERDNHLNSLKKQIDQLEARLAVLVEKEAAARVPDEVRGLYKSIDDSEVLQSKINKRRSLINKLTTWYDNHLNSLKKQIDQLEARLAVLVEKEAAARVTESMEVTEDVG